MRFWQKLALGCSLALAAAAGLFSAMALSASSTPPTQTTTISVSNGATGPTGPTGPAGPAGGGANDCPAGSTFQAVVINTPNGHVELWVCVAG